MDTPPATPRTPSRDRRAAATTPHRRSVVDLMNQLADLFATYSSDESQHDDADIDPMQRTIPLAALPQLIDTFERQRGTILLQDDEKQKLKAFAAQMPEQRVGVDMLISFIAATTASSSVPSSASGTTTHPEPANAEPEREVENTTLSEEPETKVDPARPSSPSSVASFGLLKPDPFDSVADGSPAPRRRSESSRTLSDTASTLSPIPSTIARPGVRKKRSFLAGKLSFAASPSGSTTPSVRSNPATASTSATQQHELADLVASRGGTYLGVPLDGPVGKLKVDVAAGKIRTAISSQAMTRDKEIASTLSPLTWPQIRAVDRSYETTFGSTLLDYVGTQKGLKADLEYALRGLIMGPLNFDVFLLGKALEGVTTNTTLLIDLLVARPPSAVALLRAAYRLRTSNSNLTSTPTGSLSSRHKTLDAAVLASASSNAKLKKAWEVVLQAKWEDADEDGESLLSTEERQELLNNDLDMLKVALRKGGNSDIVTKILLARSPAHIHALTLEYRGQGQSLTQCIKQVYSSSSPALAKMLLFAVENGKKDEEGPGVWRDAKSLEAAMEGPGARNDALAWRLVRLHWDRPRFKLTQQAYRQKYKNSLLDRVLTETTPASAFREVLRGVVNSVQVPEPEPTPEDERRLAALMYKKPASPLLSEGPKSSETSDTGAVSPTELEGTGELSNPPSPRSTTPEVERGDAFDEPRSSSTSPTLVSRPVLPPSASAPELNSSTGSSSSVGSSLSFRQRSTPLEHLGHRPASSSRGSLDSSTSSLRHARPIAPARRRRPSEDLNKSTSSSGSQELMSPSEHDPRSGSVSPSFGRSPTPTTMSEHQYARVPRTSSTPTELSPALSRPPAYKRASTSPGDVSASSVTSPPTSSIENTSYYSAPISPIRDEDDEGPSIASTRFFNIPDSPETPQSLRMRRDASSASGSSSSGASRPGSLFQVEAIGSGGDFQLALMDGSPFSGRNDPETTQNMWRYATELSKKHKELEGRLQSSATSYEEQISDLEARLDEVRAELAVKKREEKDLRSNERQHLQQIGSLEGEVSKLTKQLEKGRESYDAMKKNYLGQCEEAEKLRSLVAEARRENRAAEEAAHAHSLQAQQSERDREILQGAISKLETDLAVAGRAQDTLDAQKQENLVLKETIDRLRFDLEEMQSVTRKSTFLDGTATGSPDRSMIANSMSKSLGKELARRLAQQNAADSTEDVDSEGEESDSDAEVDDEVNETVVTTHRTIHKKKKRSATLTAPEPLVRHVQKTTVLADVETQTEAIETHSLDVQTDLSAVQVTLVAAPLIDCEVSVIRRQEPPPPPPTEVELRSKLAQELGIDLIEFDRALEASKKGVVISTAPAPATLLSREHFGARRAGRYLTRMGTRAATQAPQLFINVFPGFAKPYVAQILESSMTFFLYSLTVFLTGFITGTVSSPIKHHHHFMPFQVSFGQGDLAHTAFWGEGMALGGTSGGHASEGVAYWLEKIIWTGVSTVRRVPT